MINKKTLIVIGIILMLLVTACTDNSINHLVDREPDNDIPINPKSGGKVNLATTSPIVFDPLKAQKDEEKSISSLIYEGLIKIDAEGTPQPNLAASWNISPDEKIYEFTLRDDVKWHNGRAFSSADVEFTFKKIKELKKQIKRGKEPCFPTFDNIKSFEAPNEKTFNIELIKPDTGFLCELGFGILPAVVTESTKSTVDEEAAEIIGTGPFKLVTKDSESITLTKNTDHFIQTPYIDDVVIKYFPEKSSLKEAFEKQALDMISFEPQDWDIYKGMEDVSLLQCPSTYFEFLALNLTNPLFKDHKVRQAILMGIDRDRILQDTALGRGIVIDSPVLPYSWAFNSRIEHMTFNPKKARELLEEAGWIDEDGDGVLEKTINHRKYKFEFELLVNTSNLARYQAAIHMEKSLKDLGIVVRLVNLPWDDVKAKILSKKYSAAIMGWKLAVNPDLSFMFSGKEIRSGYNFVSYSNPELDDILARAEVEKKEQKELLYQAQDIISKDLPYIFLYSPNKLIATRESLRGVKPHPVNSLYNISEWWFE